MLRAEIADCGAVHKLGHVTDAGRGVLRVAGGGADWCLGDRVRVMGANGRLTGGEIVGLDAECATILNDGAAEGARIGDGVLNLGPCRIAPDNSWVGRIIDPFGKPIDGHALRRGAVDRPLRGAPPAPGDRRRLATRLETGTAVFNTLLPLVRGQRIGLFSGAGVGKSSLLAKFARGVDADVIVIALIGERGRELREFVETVLGPAGMARSIIIAATSDQSPLVRRRCAWVAMTVAEYFRDQGQQVLLLADSITRFAEAHREVALASGETPSLRGFPPSTSHLIMELSERAGPGAGGSGDITAVFTVLVAGSDMDEPVADILRGVLDGHVVMDREIAERGRYPAINLLRSVSRSLPMAASDAENALIAQARRLLGAYDRAELMIQAGLYVPGSDPTVDAAIRVWPKLDAFLAEDEPENGAASFARLGQILGISAET
jgi:flagellum-specific ATP synthase